MFNQNISSTYWSSSLPRSCGSDRVARRRVGCAYRNQSSANTKLRDAIYLCPIEKSSFRIPSIIKSQNGLFGCGNSRKNGFALANGHRGGEEARNADDAGLVGAISADGSDDLVTVHNDNTFVQDRAEGDGHDSELPVMLNSRSNHVPDISRNADHLVAPRIAESDSKELASGSLVRDADLDLGIWRFELESFGESEFGHLHSPLAGSFSLPIRPYLSN
jgi:hypothetical protein